LLLAAAIGNLLPPSIHFLSAPAAPAAAVFVASADAAVVAHFLTLFSNCSVSFKGQQTFIVTMMSNLTIIWF
jgi:hypothetical protein